ncbi:hypothetical protein JCM4814A_03660 [Streptomyces phaeofaciens JCM 4814]|uniref:hypothetical protein n=1 Tax=Streptomyces phaeofaciens TaxID=68254 RepID=UPI001676EFA1|nr:hypothetical protein [Streptomyces phaeofaciens]
MLAARAVLVETVALPCDPNEIATHLRGQLHGLPDTPTLVVLARANNGLGTDGLTAVRDALMDVGYPGAGVRGFRNVVVGQVVDDDGELENCERIALGLEQAGYEAGGVHAEALRGPEGLYTGFLGCVGVRRGADRACRYIDSALMDWTMRSLAWSPAWVAVQHQRRMSLADGR